MGTVQRKVSAVTGADCRHSDTCVDISTVMTICRHLLPGTDRGAAGVILANALILLSIYYFGWYLARWHRICIGIGVTHHNGDHHETH